MWLRCRSRSIVLSLLGLVGLLGLTRRRYGERVAC